MKNSRKEAQKAQQFTTSIFAYLAPFCGHSVSYEP